MNVFNRPPKKDHPRSRGVYVENLPVGKDQTGSSPLARGLRYQNMTLSPMMRIIPARAGFTQTGVTDCSGFWDHPRSRGVYPIIQARDWSSSWIIPARAGFTGMGLISAGCGRDHPRSRGVYTTTGTSNSPSTGSSPLARGLLIGISAPIYWVGIIPARAGFTGTCSTCAYG